MTAPDSFENELILKAKKSSSLDELFDLCTSPVMNVRRAVARNRNTSELIANKLSKDPVLNVSYMANLHPNCTEKRNFDPSLLTGCVICEKDENDMYCVDCPNRR